MSDYLDLYDFRIRVSSMYRERNRALLAGENEVAVWQHFLEARNELFARHPQSALDVEQRRNFQGLRYFPYNPQMRCEADVDTSVEPIVLTVAMNADESMTMTRVAHLHFMIGEQAVSLAMYWLNIYGGGLFLPFRDATSPGESYGGGRYLFDTIKGSDFLTLDDVSGRKRAVLDFNYAYNPSCAYNSRWVCPLAPLENRLSVAITAGEKNFTH
jgi:uncharacterized protein